MTNGHPTREEDFDLYALGALDADERLAIESHIAACADCRRKLAEARGRIAMIGLAGPAAAPSPLVREQLLARVRVAPSVPSTRPVRQPERIATRTPPPAPRETAGILWWPRVIAPALALIIAVFSAILWRQNDNLKSQLHQLRSDVALQQKQLQDARAQLEESQHAADLLAAHDTIVIPLAPMPGAPQGTARVAYSSHMGMLMYDGTLAPPPDDKCYELWLVPMKGAPINAGVFHPVAGSTDHWMTQIPAGVTPKAFAITLEPMGGMSHPTGPKLLIASVS